MPLSRNKLYTILIVACTAGYIWLFFNFNYRDLENKSVEICIFKSVTNIPCPSCGATRSIISMVNGDFLKSLLINPLGYIITSIMLVSPLWIAIDILTKRKTLYELYHKIELKLKNPQYAIPLILLIVCNWIWNITKGI